MSWRTMKRSEKIILLLILLLGFGVRLFLPGRFPDGINQDEAYAGYHAYSLLHYGIDAEGYHNPVYFNSWGDGMSVLYSYLTIPFLLLNGGHLSLWVTRLPQAVFACVTLVVFYLLLRRIFKDGRVCLFGLFLLAVCPWHIILSRWGLDANLAPAFLVFGLFFWVKSMEHPRFYLAAALCYGLSLYCYATLWIIVPCILLMQFAYAAYTGKWKPNKYFFAALGILALLALPLLLFLLVNNGFIPEIRTGFLSIPKMMKYRGGEMSLNNLKTSVLHVFRIFTGQQDDSIFNTAGEFGLYYKFSTVFILIGLFGFLRAAFRNLKKKEFHPNSLVIMQIIPVLLFGFLLPDANVNKLNAAFIPMVICCIQGFVELGGLLRRNILGYAVFAYAVCFCGFFPYFLTEFNESWGRLYWTGGGEAIEAAKEKTDGRIYTGDTMIYPIVLYYSELPAPVYLDTVQYREGTVMPASFDRFVCERDSNNIDEEGAYVVGIFEKAGFEELGFQTETYGSYVVAWKE